MTKRTKLIPLALLATGAAALAAAGPGSPAQESFRLISVAGRELPVVVEQEGECREELQSAMLTLETEGKWSLVAMEREICGTNQNDEEERDHGTYKASGATVEFFDVDGKPAVHNEGDDELDVAGLREGTRSSDEVTVRLADGKTDLVFRK